MNSILNRINAPISEEIKDFKIAEGKSIRMSNNVDIHYIDAGTSDVIKLSLVCDGGIRNETLNGVANATSSMLNEGTRSKSSVQIADELDFWGAYFQTQCYRDDNTLNLFCLKKHYKDCLPYISDIIRDSVFPENELDIYKKNAQQKLMVNKKRNSFLVRRFFYSSIFGPLSKYGTFLEPDDYNNFSRENLVSFYEANYKSKIKYLIISGAVDASIINLTREAFSSLKKASDTNIPIKSNGIINDRFFFEKKDSVQSAIRIGRRIVNRTHPDFRKLQVLNLILGGYFGSRLMKNIREEKGLTYGIYSVLESFKDDACFFIETEINNELCEQGSSEIYYELKKLREELIPSDELNIAKNYLLGSFLRSIDGPFSIAERHKILVDNNLDYNFYYDYIKIIKEITATELRDLANIYFQENDLSEIIVGCK